MQQETLWCESGGAANAEAIVAVAPDTAPHIFTVSEITHAIKSQLESRWADVWVCGEVTGCRGVSAGGHCYFSLKDEQSVLGAVAFRGVISKFKFKIENGQMLVLHGKVDVYAPQGKYQLIVDQAEPQGVGALQLAFEQLKTRLHAEGLFDARHKKSLPTMPRCIGVVTSPTGAALRDILNVLQRRYPAAEILIAPAKVQGEGAAQTIADAIALLDLHGACDVLIVGRGGGSMEDLWAFNEEVVARAIFASRTPIVSAVGHEIDFTIADFVADLRAPTPSAAAEMVVPDRMELTERVLRLRQQLMTGLRRWLQLREQRAADLTARLKPPTHRMGDWLLRIDQSRERLRLGMERRVADSAVRVASFAAELQHLSPLAVLAKGYAVVQRPDGRAIRTRADLAIGDTMHIQLTDGRCAAQVKELL